MTISDLVQDTDTALPEGVQIREVDRPALSQSPEAAALEMPCQVSDEIGGLVLSSNWPIEEPSACEIVGEAEDSNDLDLQVISTYDSAPTVPIPSPLRPQSRSPWISRHSPISPFRFTGRDNAVVSPPAVLNNFQFFDFPEDNISFSFGMYIFHQYEIR